jgi:exodeoxyribonuclease VII large subunit
MWKGSFQRLRVKPEEGMEVIATGKVTTYPGKSTYQIVIETIEPAGVGALLAQLEERRRRLAAEGLFDDARKQLLPFLPSVVGVITSPTGAVIRDILHRVQDRFPLRVIVWPVRVQGETSGAEVARAIEGFNALPEGGKIARPDVIIVARGGGSLEDLWGFNEEIVVRAAASSMIPLVSAVGHETDWTLIDHAADRRAPTPTAAAEMTVPVRSEMAAQTDGLARRLLGVTLRLSEQRRANVRALVRALPSSEDVLAMPRQRLDRVAENLPRRIAAALGDRHLKVNRLGAIVARHSPQAELRARRERLKGLGLRLRQALITRRDAEKATCERQRERLNAAQARMRNALQVSNEGRRRNLASVWKLIESMSHKSILARGFALVCDGADGPPIRSAATISAGQALTLQFADGSVAATANGGEPGAGAEDASARPKSIKAPRPAIKTSANQGSLF